MSNINFAVSTSGNKRKSIALRVVASLGLLVLIGSICAGMLIHSKDTTKDELQEVNTTFAVDMLDSAQSSLFRTRVESLSAFHEIKNTVDQEIKAEAERKAQLQAENMGDDADAGYRTMSYEVLDELFRAQNKNPHMTLEETEKIAGEAMDLGTRYARDEHGKKTDKLLQGYAWSDEVHHWQLQIWYDDKGRMCITEIQGDFDVSKSKELQDIVDTSDPEGE